MADDIKKTGKQIAKEIEVAVDKGIDSVKAGTSKTAEAGANVLGKGADALNSGKRKLTGKKTFKEKVSGFFGGFKK
ncbi:unnamed protein product [Auanema sp. JU1783]|nr:unnamed protein product [Auanema sp. JU1783]